MRMTGASPNAQRESYLGTSNRIFVLIEVKRPMTDGFSLNLSGRSSRIKLKSRFNAMSGQLKDGKKKKITRVPLVRKHGLALSLSASTHTSTRTSTLTHSQSHTRTHALKCTDTHHKHTCTDTHHKRTCTNTLSHQNTYSFRYSLTRELTNTHICASTHTHTHPHALLSLQMPVYPNLRHGRLK